MTLENFCYNIYKHTFALVVFEGIYAAHVFVKMKKNPFETDELEEAFRKFIRDTPLSNLDLTIVEDPAMEDNLMILDSVEPFGDGDSFPERIPFHVDVRRIYYNDEDCD